MRLHVEGDGFAVANQDGDSQELWQIVNVHLPKFLALFAKKNKDYGNGFSNELGIKGQYSDIHRKVGKLRRAMWDGEDLQFEGVAEILRDLIGNAFLTMYMLDQAEGLDREFAFSDNVEEEEFMMKTIMNLGGPEMAMSRASDFRKPFGEKMRGICKKMLDAQHEHEKKEADREAYLRLQNEKKNEELKVDESSARRNLNTRDYNFYPDGAFEEKQNAYASESESVGFGDIVEIGPEAFASADGKVVCWRGQNYAPQPDPEVLVEESYDEASAPNEDDPQGFYLETLRKNLARDLHNVEEEIAQRSKAKVADEILSWADTMESSNVDAEAPIGYRLVVEVDSDGPELAFRHPSQDTHPATAVPERELSNLMKSAKELYDKARELNQWGNCL